MTKRNRIEFLEFGSAGLVAYPVLAFFLVLYLKLGGAVLSLLFLSISLLCVGISIENPLGRLPVFGALLLLVPAQALRLLESLGRTGYEYSLLPLLLSVIGSLLVVQTLFQQSKLLGPTTIGVRNFLTAQAFLVLFFCAAVFLAYEHNMSRYSARFALVLNHVFAVFSYLYFLSSVRALARDLRKCKLLGASATQLETIL